MDCNRRDFLGAMAAVAAPLPAAEPGGGIARKYWIDPKLAELPARPWRKVHQDFHNTPYVGKIGERFDADEFGGRLLEARVNGIVVFAKDMHGYFYYPSRYGPVHPGLSFDLLKRQVEACRKRRIAVYAYYCTTWDHYLAENHPEWLVVKRDRTTYLPKFDQTPGWTALCLSRRDFVQLMLDHAREFVTGYELDGAWFDMPVPAAGECFCSECLKQLRGRGLDPFDTQVQRRHKLDLHKDFIRRIKAVVEESRPGCQVDFNGQGVYGLSERVPFMDNLDIEALPTAFWGYYYFPTIVRYARTHGLTTYGQTGRFQGAWADFGGLKLPAQLETEVAGIVANGAHCCIGDQPPPSARLDPAVYHVIGRAYARIQALEPYLERAVPVTEAAIITGGLPLESPAGEPNYGLVKLLIESRVQFDVVEPAAGWERYALVVLADSLEVDAALAQRLHAFIQGGGAVIVSDRSGLAAGTEKSWLERYGLHYAGPSPFKPSYMVPKAGFTGDIPPFEYALYEGASQWRAESPAQVLAALGVPRFQRSAEHYTSHAQTPFDHETGFAAAARSGRVALFAFPLGISYYSRGYWIYRRAFQHALRELLPAPLLETNAPLSSELTLTRQAGGNGRRERFMVHVVNFSALRRSPRHPDFYEDPISLTDVRVTLNLPLKAAAGRAVVAGASLSLKRLPGGGVQFTIPRVPVHEVVAIEAG